MSWTQEEWDAWKNGTWGHQKAASLHKPRILVVRMGFLENMIPIFPNLFRVIVIFATQMKFMDCSFHVKYRRQAGLESISWRGRDVTSLKLHELCWQGWNNFALRSLVKGDMRAYFLLAPSKHSCLSYAEVPGKQG